MISNMGIIKCLIPVSYDILFNNYFNFNLFTKNNKFNENMSQ